MSSKNHHNSLSRTLVAKIIGAASVVAVCGTGIAYALPQSVPATPVTVSTAQSKPTVQSANSAEKAQTLAATPNTTATSNPTITSQVLAAQSLPLVNVPDITKIDGVNSTDVEQAQRSYMQAVTNIDKNSRDAIRLASESGKKSDEAAAALVQWNDKKAFAATKKQEADEKKDMLGQWASEVYRVGSLSMSPQVSTTMKIIQSKDGDNALDGINQLNRLTDKKAQIVQQANDAQKLADDAEAQARSTKEAADNMAVEAKKLADDSETARVSSITASAQAQTVADDLSAKINTAEISSGIISPISASQRVLNVAAINQWNDYLKSLNEASIHLPTRAELADPAKSLPEGFDPVLSSDGNVMKGAASPKNHPDLIVLPFETLQSVSQSLSSLGANYTADGLNGGFSCSSLLAAHYTNPVDTSLAGLWTQGKYVPMVDKLPGDAVFFSTADAGITQAGIYLGAGLVLDSSAASGHVEINKVDDSAFGIIRPSVAPDGAIPPAPVADPNAPKIICGGIEGQSSAGASSFKLPVSSGNFELGLKFGDSDADRFGKKTPTSPGTEFIGSAENANVFAVADGNVEVKKNDPKWGNVITLTQADGTKTTYANMNQVLVADGSNVSAGRTIGTMGQSGSSANEVSPSVLVSMTVKGKAIDPMGVLIAAPAVITAGGSGNYSRGTLPNGGTVLVNAEGYYNGQLPDNILCPITSVHRMRCDAASAFVLLNAAYKAHFGTDIAITDSYRSYPEQVAVRAKKPGLAAVPGTSNHGWGLALDLGGGIQSFGTVQHQWMQDNAPLYGFYHPAWAEPTGSKPEAWHWEFIGAKK